MLERNRTLVIILAAALVIVIGWLIYAGISTSPS
jgi:hypothetical protein